MVRRKPPALVSRTGAALFGVLVFAAVLPVVVPLFLDEQNLAEGDRAPRTIEAVHDAQFESQALTEAARDEAERNVASVELPIDLNVRLQQATTLTRLLDQVRAIRLRTDLSQQQQLDELGNLSAATNLSVTGRRDLLLIDRATFDAFPARVQRALTEILDKGVREDGATKAVDEYFAVPANVPERSTEFTALRELLRVFVVPNVRPDAAATELKRQEARKNVSPVIVSYTAGQVVVREGDVIEADTLEAMRETGVISDTFDYLDAAGGTIIACGAALMLGLFVFRLQPFQRPAARRGAIVLVGLVVVLLTMRILFPQFAPDNGRGYVFAIPIAAAAMIGASFGDLSFATVLGVVASALAVFVATTTPDLAGSGFVGPLEPVQLFIAYGAGSMVGAFAVHRAERIGRIAFAAVPVAAATWLVVFAFWLLSEPRSNEALGWLSLAAGVNGLLSAVLTLGCFVLLSLALSVTTRFQLLELAQADHPLLHRLQEEAPGTFHHSMMVGSLSERAATVIGADPLLAKVGAYYHDIGKLTQPGNFIENMLDGGGSPHDSLPPARSAGLIREHVIAGIDLGRRYRLPDVVRDFIPQHHGTRLVTFFYRRALEAGEDVQIADFRYPGPRPVTAEAAIVMLADSCEAVVRARQDRTLREIDGLVDGIFAERLAEGQLDDCDITMKELQRVAASFKATLRAVYHPRIEYPQPTPEEIAAIASGAEQQTRTTDFA